MESAGSPVPGEVLITEVSELLPQKQIVKGSRTGYNMTGVSGRESGRRVCGKVCALPGQTEMRLSWRIRGNNTVKIGIISDTHNLLRPEVIANLQDCGCILHAGDISSRKILEELERIAPVRAVRGNNDKEWAEDLPLFLDFEAGGLRICMAHKKKDLPGDLSPYDLVIFGHSHQYASDWLDCAGGKRTLLLNPGSCGPRRLIQPVTMAVLQIDPDGWDVKRIGLPHTEKEKAPAFDRGDIRRQVEIVVRDTRKGMAVEDIAKKNRIDPELAEQIVRLYVTHPGVTADGIMTKLGLLGKL